MQPASLPAPAAYRCAKWPGEQSGGTVRTYGYLLLGCRLWRRMPAWGFHLGSIIDPTDCMRKHIEDGSPPGNVPAMTANSQIEGHLAGDIVDVSACMVSTPGFCTLTKLESLNMHQPLHRRPVALWMLAPFCLVPPAAVAVASIYLALNPNLFLYALALSFTVLLLMAAPQKSLRWAVVVLVLLGIVFAFSNSAWWT